MQDADEIYLCEFFFGFLIWKIEEFGYREVAI